jgi:hypothetical protein
VGEHELEPGVARFGIRDKEGVPSRHGRVPVDDRQHAHVTLVPQARELRLHLGHVLGLQARKPAADKRSPRNEHRETRAEYTA